tara:strand:- start:12 stop:140 length:129 start_codon:yes stop_codon:yes gene_type:complete
MEELQEIKKMLKDIKFKLNMLQRELLKIKDEIKKIRKTSINF